MSLPWSSKGNKGAPGVAADEIMILDSQDEDLPTKNKLMTFQNLGNSLLDLSSIAGLDDGQTTIQPTSLVAFEQGGEKFRASMIPNPPRQISVTTQEQLEVQFTSNIEIPDGQSWLISFDESFTLTKPIKLGNGSAVRAVGKSTIIITYQGAGAMFRNTNPAQPIDSFDMRFMQITGNGTNTAFDLRGTSFFFIDRVQIVDFDDIGFIKTGSVEINSLGMFKNKQGFRFQDVAAFSTKVILINQLDAGDTGMTAFSFIQSVPTLIIFDDIRALAFAAGESLLFFDPNAPVDTAYVLTNATLVAGNLFQPGLDLAAAAIAAGSDPADTQFDITNHGLLVGQVVVLKNFTPEPYDGTFIVTAVNDTDSVDIGVSFTLADTGFMSAKSLDSTDVLVSAFNNPGAADSMFTAESGYEDPAALETTITTVEVPVVIVNNNFAFSNLERFAEGTADQGQIVTLDPSTRRYAVSFSGSLSAASSNIIMGLVLLKNGSLVGFNPPRSPLTQSAQVGGINIIELSENDTLEVGVINYTNANNIAVTHVSLVVNRA